MKANLPFKFILSEKCNKQYVVFDFKDDNGKRKRKWVSTDLPANCKKRDLDKKVKEIVKEFYQNYLDGVYTTPTEPKKQVSIEKPKNTAAEQVRTVSEETEPAEEETKPSENKDTAKEVITASDVAKLGSDCKFTTFMSYWLETTKPTIAISSYHGYCRCVKKINTYFDEHYPDLRLKDVTALQIQQFYNDSYDAGLSGNTIKHLHANIHRALKYGVKMDLLDCNVSEKVDLPKVEKFEASFCNKEELEEILEAFKGDRLELVVNIAAYYGLRRSEIIGLKWDCIDFEKKTITVRRKITNSFGDGKEQLIVENQLKTESSVRTFPLIPHIEAMLRERKMLEDYYSCLLGDGYDREFNGFVCRDNSGKLITPEFVTTHFKTVLKKKNLKKIRFHDLRHSCASLLLANGVSMKAIQEWMGHSTFNVTANFYSHLEYNSKINSAEIIANVLGGADEEETEEKK